MPSDSSELAAALPPVPTAGATPPFYGANECSWAEAAGTQRAAGMPHALGRRPGGSAAGARATGGVQAARAGRQRVKTTVGASCHRSLERGGMGDSRVKAATADKRDEVDGRVSASCRSQRGAGSVVANKRRGGPWVARGCPVDRCSIYHNSFANFEVYLAVVAADDGEEV
ncbi:hypothetical protein B0H14DRAFT_3172116 [Mycena olivaceomarginata]|nr:hypothetical protein B0H14DRAFT_3172116 [Mycena olivaceomarginata]